MTVSGVKNDVISTLIRTVERIEKQLRKLQSQDNSFIRASTTNVSNPPTAAELVTAFGSLSTLGDGYAIVIDDNNGHANGWLILTAGGTWWRVALTKTT